MVKKALVLHHAFHTLSGSPLKLLIASYNITRNSCLTAEPFFFSCSPCKTVYLKDAETDEYDIYYLQDPICSVTLIGKLRPALIHCYTVATIICITYLEEYAKNTKHPLKVNTLINMIYENAS